MNTSRRKLLVNAGLGLGGLTLSTLLPGGGMMQAASAASLADPLAPKDPHFAAKAKSVIWLHMDGAPSTLELYDYKPELVRLAGQEVPASFLEGHQDEHARRRRQAVRDAAHVEAIRRKRRLVLGPAAELGAARRRHGVHQVEQDHRRDARHLDIEAQHRRPEPGPADARRVDLVRARLRESRPAAVRRAVQRHARAGRRQRELGVGLPACGLPRHAVPRGPVADPVPRSPRARGRGAATRQLRSA